MARSSRNRPHRSRPTGSDLFSRETRLLPPAGNSGLRTALCFPNTYAVGMSNLGFQQVYRIFSEHPDVRPERFFLDPDDAPPKSLEEDSSLGNFRLIAFSLTYEVDSINLVKMLRSAGIPIRSADRGPRDPYILIGGIAVTANPLPLSPLADIIVLGDAEEPLPVLLDKILPAIDVSPSREGVLSAVAEVPGVYVPLIHGSRGFESVGRRIADNLDSFPCRSVILSPDTVFADMFLIEVSRGCRRGCRFCLVGWMTPDLRLRSAAKVISDIEEYGRIVRKVGLVGAELTSHPEIEEIVEFIVKSDREVSLSSAELDHLSPKLLELLAEGGVETITLAPEAGSDNLRKILHKAYSEEEILNAVTRIGEAGIPNVKLYFLAGLPEIDEIEEADPIVDLVAKIRQSFRGKRITVNLSPLVPKPFTPIGRKAVMRSASEIRKVISHVRKGIGNLSGVQLQDQSLREAETDNRICNGDETVFEWIVGQAERMETDR